MARRPAASGPAPLHVSVLALPEIALSTLAGIFDVMNGATLTALGIGNGNAPFEVEVVGERAGRVQLASGVPFEVKRGIADVAATDIVIVPSVVLPDGWRTGRYPHVVEWARRMHARAARCCAPPARASSCSRRRACSTAAMPRCTSSTRMRSGGCTRRCPSIRTACW